MSIGLVGFGFVGQALYASLRNPTSCVVYDPPKGFKDFSDIRRCDIIFCCLPSPMKADGSQDFSYYKDFFTKIQGFEGVIVVKSTVLLSDIAPYFDMYNIVMNPEFLNQNSSHEDFKNQKIVILGGRTDLCLKVKERYEHSFSLAAQGNIEYVLCTADEAIHIKYTHNIYHAYKVLFWNYIHETFGNHRKLFNAYSKITGNTFEMSNICSDGRPGYGGACFPKDVAAANSEKPHELTQFMIKYNKKIRGDNEV